MRRKGRPEMGKNKVVRPHGQVRRSQMVGSNGPGAMLDLPNHAALIGGLECWGDPALGALDRVFDERLQAKLEEQLEVKGLRFYSPPIELDRNSEHPKGVTVWEFPEWFVAQYERPD